MEVGARVGRAFISTIMFGAGITLVCVGDVGHWQLWLGALFLISAALYLHFGKFQD
jgi:hypothetical protein